MWKNCTQMLLVLYTNCKNDMVWLSLAHHTAALQSHKIFRAFYAHLMEAARILWNTCIYYTHTYLVPVLCLSVGVLTVLHRVNNKGRLELLKFYRSSFNYHLKTDDKTFFLTSYYFYWLTFQRICIVISHQLLPENIVLVYLSADIRVSVKIPSVWSEQIK